MTVTNALTLLTITWLASAFTVWNIVGARNREFDKYFPRRRVQHTPWGDMIFWAAVFIGFGFILGVYVQIKWSIV